MAPVTEAGLNTVPGGRCLSRRLRGFSLIELLVVLVVIGLAVGMVSLTITLDEPAAVVREESDGFVEKMRFALDDAIFSGETLGLYIVPGDLQQPWRYGWLRYRDRQWQMQTDVLALQRLPGWMMLELRVENEPVDLVQLSAANTQPQPVIAIYPSGEITPFVLRFYSSEHGVADGVGRRVLLDSSGQLVSYQDGEDSSDLR